MKGKISTGIWFIFFGVIALLHNFDIINFNFWAILPYWPLLIIALGANLIFQNKSNGTFILSFINIALCLFLTYIGITSNNRFNITENFKENITVGTSNDTTDAYSSISTPYDPTIESTKLDLNLGALAITIDSNSTQDLLLHADVNNNNIGLKLTRNDDEGEPKIEVSSVIKRENAKNSRATLALNTNPLWDLTVNMGAVSFKGNLSNHKFSNIEINAGAASIDLQLGMPAVEESRIEINTAASAFKINIPKEAACRVDKTTILSSTKLDGFVKKDDYYETPNYENADKKYIISLDGVTNSLKINRY